MGLIAVAVEHDALVRLERRLQNPLERVVECGGMLAWLCLPGHVRRIEFICETLDGLRDDCVENGHRP